MCLLILKQILSTRFLLLYLQESYSFIISIFCINKCNLNTRNKNCLHVTKMLFFDCVMSASVSMVTHSVYCMLTMCATTQGNLNVNPCYSCSINNLALCLPVPNQVFSSSSTILWSLYVHVLVGSLLLSDTHVYVRI